MYSIFLADICRINKEINMEFKGTKGKWEVEERNTIHEVTISCNKKRICQVKSFTVKTFNDPTTEEANYNALLISKAPEMLEMLSKSLYFIDYRENSIFYNQIEKLIEQATKIY